MLRSNVFYGKIVSDKQTGQNKAIRDRIIPVNSHIIYCERRENGWTGSGQSTTPSSIWKAI